MEQDEGWQGSRKSDFFRQKGWWRDETLTDWLSACVARAPDAVAVAETGRTMSYRELANRAGRLASALAGLGVEPGDAVAVQLPNILEFVVAWLAIAARGAILQTVHMPYGPGEIEPLLRHSGATTAIALGDLKGRSPAGEIARLSAKLPALKRVIVVGAPVPGTVPFGDLLGTEPPARSAAGTPVGATDAYVQLYTSGTTAAPKGVRVTYNHFLSNARMCAAELGITANDRLLCAAPFTHLYGLYVLELGLAVGASACLLPLFTPADFAAACRGLRPTYVFAGPAHIAGCFQQGLLDRDDLDSLRIAVLSGSTVPPELSAALEDRLSGGKVLQAWGMTELQFGACSRPTDRRDIRFETIGSATPGTEVRVVGEDGAPLAPGTAGELQIRGCSVFQGYVGFDPATSTDFTADGWFRTGDLAMMDAEGHVKLTGRLKELINRGGIKINPIDVELAIAAHPAVAQVAVAPIPDAVLGERACCFVVLRPNAHIDLDGLRTHLAQQTIAKAKWPERLELVAEMPMTPTRKIMKGELVRRLLSTAPPAQTRPQAANAGGAR